MMGTTSRSVSQLVQIAALLVSCRNAATDTAATTSGSALAAGEASAKSATSAAASEANLAAIATLRKAIDERYSYRDRLGIDWSRSFEVARPELERAGSPRAFAERAHTLLKAAKDVHIWLDVAGGERFGSGAPPPNFNIQLLPRLLTDAKQRGPCLASARLARSTPAAPAPGYILLGDLKTGHCREVEAGFAAALEQLKDAPALIIDVRPNTGGDENIARTVARHFVDRPTLYARRELRDPTVASGFAPPMHIMLEPAAGERRYERPVAVLMGPANMSSCEAFLLMMRAAGAKLVGERSLGASARPMPHDLGNGVTVVLPSWRAMDANGQPLEGVGIAPDIEVKTSAADLIDKDPVIDAAVRALLPAAKR